MSPLAGSRSPGLSRLYAAALAAVGWFALAIQLYLIVRGVPRTAAGIAGAIDRFVSFFTIVTNLLVAVAVTAWAWTPGEPETASARRPRVATALAAYISIVGLIYSLLLRNLWQPTGLQKIADVLLHDAVPIAYVVYWLAFVPKGRLAWRDVLPWLLYPLGYALYSGVRGALVGSYPYPFIDIGALGYPRVLLNVALLTLLFCGVGLAFIAIDRTMGRRVAVRATPS